MYRMDVVAGIPHAYAVALALLHLKGCGNGFVAHRISYAVNRPAVEALHCCIVFGEQHVEGFIRCRNVAVLPKLAIVPLERRRRHPLRLALHARILHHNSHAVMPVVVGRVTHDPNARMVHLHDGGNALRCAQPQHRHTCRIRHGIAVQRHHAKNVSRQRQAANLCRAAVEHVKEHALPTLDAYRFSMAKHASVDGERAVAYLVTMRHAFGKRRLHRGLTLLLELRILSCGRQNVHRHIAAAAERGLKLLERQEHLAVIPPWILFWLDINRYHLPAVLPRIQVSACAIVRVIETQSRRIWGELNPALAMCWYPWRSLLRRTVYVSRDLLTMPVQLLRNIRVVDDLDRHRLAFLKSQQRSRKLSVVSGGRNDALWRDLHRSDFDANSVVVGCSHILRWSGRNVALLRGDSTGHQGRASSE